jgi:hypothetical protein
MLMLVFAYFGREVNDSKCYTEEAGITQSVWSLTTGLNKRWIGVPSPSRAKNLLFSTSLKPALRTTEPP